MPLQKVSYCSVCGRDCNAVAAAQTAKYESIFPHFLSPGTSWHAALLVDVTVTRISRANKTILATSFGRSKGGRILT